MLNFIMGKSHPAYYWVYLVAVFATWVIVGVLV